MDSRPILKKRTKLGILIDSKSFDNLLSKGDDANVETVLKYFRSDPFEFVRSPFDTTHDELEKVSAFVEKYDDKGNLSAIETVRNKSPYILFFRYQMQDIEEMGKFIHSEKEAIVLTYVQARLNSPDGMNIFITDNKTLLKKRLWLESHVSGFPQGCHLNIVTIEGAKEIMDLFSKYQNKYYISGKYSCNEGQWYWLSFLSKVPNFHVGHVGDPFLYAFSNRFIYLLMCVDKMGFQYYLGVNNDTLNNILYHFNYFISLMTGIFDSLAIITKEQYNLTFKGKHIPPAKISLNPRAGKDFLKALRDSNRNPNLRKHINNYVNFIKLIYQLREVIIHREMLQKTALEFIGSDEKWKANFVKINPDIAKCIHLCNDGTQKYEPITQWGMYRSNTDNFLEPFQFAKSATKILITFSNEYLELSDFLFSWDSVPGDDDEKMESIIANFEIGWAENAEILKSDDGKTISIFKDEKSAKIIIDEKKEKATLKITDGRTHELKVKKENGKLNIYKNKNKDDDSVGRIDVF